MVYYFCYCMSLHVCPGVNFILDSRSAVFWEAIVLLVFYL